MAQAGIDASIVTPVKGPGLIAGFLSGPAVIGFGAKLAGCIGRAKPFRVAGKVVATRHAHVCEALSRDLDFAIAPVNAAKILEVNGGPFILGMDRSAVLERERQALYEALHAVDMHALQAAAQADADARLAAVPAGGEIDAVGGYARPVAAGTARRLFGLKVPSDGMIMEVARSIFAHTFLNLGDDKTIRDRAIRAGNYMQSWLADEIAARRASGQFGDDMMGALLRQDRLDDAGIRRTLGGMFVGAVDTTASCVAKILYVVGRDPDLAARMAADADDLKRLYGWCNEALRRWPHNPIVMREAVRDSELAGAAVKKGDRIIAFTQAAMFDPEAFDDPDRLRPDRDPSLYLHLGGGLHPCSGRPVNAFQIPLLVAGLLRRGLGEVGRIGWAGPFPHRLIVKLLKD
ncbi:MAG: cytochrome P450 [Alphaproteobacteria bacterium]|nr:cytochrome P450 [Alphaproteobacteria bacterium]MBV9372895.1 cytochrome P450 [Alphaproteobacteria bacterium]MBV9902083.1 cytochrome P450 [Alphaproteobacteria bacterium]